MELRSEKYCKKDCSKVCELGYFFLPLYEINIYSMSDRVYITQSVCGSVAEPQKVKHLDSCFSIVVNSDQNDVTTVLFC